METFPLYKRKESTCRIKSPTSNQLKFKKLDETFIIKDFATKLYTVLIKTFNTR
jgi:hypothetical protein